MLKLRREVARLQKIKTDCQRAEEALRESEGLFGATFEHAAVGMDQVDLHGRFIRVNDRLCKLLGYQREELMRLSIRDITVPEDVDKSFELLHKLQSGEIDEYTLKKRYRRKGGSVFWADLFVSLVRDAKGGPLYHVGIIQDITERRRAEEALKESEQKFRATFEQAPLGISHRSLREEFLLVNQRFCDMVGFSPEELKKKTSADITHPDDLPTGAEMMGKLIKGEMKRYSREKRYLRKDGSVLWVNATVSLMRDDLGQPKYFISLLEDITERKWAREALQREKERFRILVEELPLGISLINPDGSWAYVNPAFVRIFGYDLSDVASGRDWFHKAFPDERLRNEAIALWFADQKEGEFNVAKPRTFRIKCKDGSQKTVTITSIALKTKEYFVLCEDITERVRAEEEKLKSERLQAAMETAGAASHEINQPLQIIMARAELALMKGPLIDNLGRELQDILENTERIALITKRLNRITEFRTTDYIGGTQVLDIERSSKI